MAKLTRQSFDWKTALNWRDMLNDAPSRYSPHWMGLIEDEKLAAHCQMLYMQLRQDADNGNGVSLMRDLVLRRIVWSVRILERVEQALLYWEGKIEDDDYPLAEEMLVKYMKFHSQQSNQLMDSISKVLVEMPPLKTVRQIAGGHRRAQDKVTFPETEELDDDRNQTEKT